MNKQILILALVVLMVGVVVADREIIPFDGIVHIDNFSAGDTVAAKFGYFYIEYISDNVDNSPLIIRMNITSNDSNYSVWKDDFELSGYIERYIPFWGFWMFWEGEPYEEVVLTCSEKPNLTINHPLGSTNMDVPNGTFYCYNVSKDLRLNKMDIVSLSIKSHQALWPGQYNLTAEFFYVEDTMAPFVNILNKNYFENNYFRTGNSFTVNVTIEDNVELKENGYGGIIFNNSVEEFRFNGHIDNEIYYFPWEVPTNMEEGNYEIQIFAEDDMGNRGLDNTTLKIDNSGPEITLISPANSSIYDNTISIKLNVTDAKSGEDNSSVYYRISETVNGTFYPCPSEGEFFGTSCYNSGWMTTELSEISEYYEDEFNATNVTSGSYYFEAKAKDILGNEGVL